MKAAILIILVALLGECTSSRILCLMPMASRSHTITVETVCKELAERNHDITAVTNYPISNPLPNYKQISVEEMKEFMERKKEEFDMFSTQGGSMVLMTPFLYNMGTENMELFLSHPKVVELIESEEKFDLIFCEIFLTESAFAGFSQRFQAPIVILAPFMANIWSNNMVGNPAPYSYIPDPFLGLDTKMTFLERFTNVAFGLVHGFLYHCLYLPKQDAIMKKHFGEDLPPLKDILKNVSLVLVNHHHSLAYSRPYTPNMVEVAGMHVREPKKLPKDLQKYLDDAKEGVIYFSLGTNAESAKMPEEKLKIFIEVFSKLKMRVLWKWETDDLPGKPDNVKISKWLPQSDILAHPNLKLFITHGGLGSIIETVHRGVPIVGIPIFAEQPLNVRHAEYAGFGKLVEFRTLCPDTLYDAILEVVENPKYRETAQRRSALLKDTPISAMETVIYWINYVLRHKGASHMRSAAQDLTWYQLYLVDVLVVLIGGTVLMTGISFCLVRKCVRSLCKSKPKKSKNAQRAKKEN